MRLDIFCQVIDNFGDAGVCLRLARQLVREYPVSVRLIIDQPAILEQLNPTPITGLSICPYEDIPHLDVADVVIEGFGCPIPEPYLTALKKKHPIWINMEYLSAEPWVEQYHQLASLYENNLKKYFFFPGFTAKTGGILCEKNRSYKKSSRAFFNQWNIPTDHHTIVSLFCYESAPVLPLLDALSIYDVLLLVPQGVATTQLDFQKRPFFKKGTLTVYNIPFVSQEEYDLLLMACDFNFVRGEDSFVRAQLAQKPFIWQIYPQTEDVHLVKLKAFLERYLTAFQDKEADVIQKAWLSWNQFQAIDPVIKMIKEREHLLSGAKKWRHYLFQMEDFASSLYRFIMKLR